MAGTSLPQRNETVGEAIRSYVQLTKPRIIPLLLATTVAAMGLASRGRIDPGLLAVTLAGGTLAAASAQTLNCIYDRDIDDAMARTRTRPIPAGRVRSRHALIFALVLAALSFGLLAAGANLLSAALALSGIGIYMLVYTHWLKRSSAQNIVIGGAAGAVPPLVGWAAVTGDLSWTPLLLFAIVFVWTPPHFWALALLIRDDYAQVGVPMLPVVAGEAHTARQILAYAALLVPMTLLLVYPLGAAGLLYGGLALALGTILLVKAWQLSQAPADRQLARSLFKYSISYMMLLCAGLVVDSLPVTHRLMATLAEALSAAIAP